MLTMSLEEIKNLEHIIFSEDEYFIYIEPETDYYLEVEDFPLNRIFYERISMLKQSRYSLIWVKPIHDPSIGTLTIDNSEYVYSVETDSSMNIEDINNLVDPSSHIVDYLSSLN